MVKRKKKLTEKDADKLRVIDAYDHADKERTNNPPIGIAKFDRTKEATKTYAFDPNLDPTLEWAGKKEGMSFDVPTSSIHIHESIKPSKILSHVQTIGDDYLSPMVSLFEDYDPVARQKKRREALEFYKHGVDWTNRLIAGDSLVIMNSLLEKEGLAGQVQMFYFDPPYGIKYGSNFQPFINKRDVKDKKDEDLSQEPEMITAFRDTWELGIHSYLSYLRDRLLLARELLADSGSIFVQISAENVHHVRELCDEIFGKENFVQLISFRKKNMTLRGNLLEGICDFLVWYSKDINHIKYNQLFKKTNAEGDSHWNMYEMPDHSIHKMIKEEIENHKLLPPNAEIFRLSSLYPAGSFETGIFPFTFKGKTYNPIAGRSWKTHKEGMQRLAEADRLYPYESGNTLQYKMKLNDYPVSPLHNVWLDTAPAADKIYVVQTGDRAVQRCMLMTTDPDDLVLDITCGSGTTAYVAEQWGRRWITCDTSRVALELAKERLMTATFDYYKLAHPEQGISGGFVYKTVPHITLKSIANNEPPAEETLYDQPEIDKTKVRVSGPFTVESLPAPIVRPVDEMQDMGDDDLTAKQQEWRQELLATGIIGKNGNRLDFSRVEPLEGVEFFQAQAETKEDVPKRAIICFGSENKVMDVRYIDMALNRAQTMRPTPDYIIFAAFQFGPEAAQMVDETVWPGVTVLKVQMNTDLMTEDLKKKRSSNQSFWLIGQPDVELVKDKRSKNRYKVVVHGFDYYDVKKGIVTSGTDSNIAMWMLDTNYDPMNCIEPSQVFFPMEGKKGGWNKLAKTLKAEINQDLIQKYAGNESLWFTAEPNTLVAVKIIDDRGIESLRVMKVGEE